MRTVSRNVVTIAGAVGSMEADTYRLRNKNREYKLQLRRLTKAHRLLILEHKALKEKYDNRQQYSLVAQPYPAFMIDVNDAGEFISKQVAVVG